MASVLRMRANEQDDDGARLALWSAVLEQAIDDMSASTADLHRRSLAGETKAATLLSETREQIREAARWFASDSRDVGAFLWICERLGRHPDDVRRTALYGLAKAGRGEWRTQAA